MSLNPLEQINVITIAAVVVTWLAMFMILRRVLLLPLLAVMQRRQHKLDAAAAVDGDARALVDRAQHDAANIAAEAARSAEGIDRAVNDELIHHRQAKLAETSERVQAIVTRGRDELASMRASDEDKLKDQLFACSRQALHKLIGEVDDTALRVIVGSVVAAARGRR